MGENQQRKCKKHEFQQAGSTQLRQRLETHQIHPKGVAMRDTGSEVNERDKAVGNDKWRGPGEAATPLRPEELSEI